MWTQFFGDMEIPLREFFFAPDHQKEEKKKVAIEKITPLFELLEKQAAKSTGEFFFGNMTIISSIASMNVNLTNGG
ncbi:hypothetical protein SNEBB_000204, partial [Seison nebaliae]